MSKVYEALRQKEREPLSSIPESAIAQEDVTMGVDPAMFLPELGLPDRVLQTAFACEEDRHRNPESAPKSTPLVGMHSSAQSVSGNRFRRLQLSCGQDSRLVFQTDPHGFAAEQFRFLRRNLEQKFPKGAVLLITSPAPRDGKTMTAINLCACLAESGRETLLMEGDIRQPSVHRVLGTSLSAPGIEDAMAGAMDPENAVSFVEKLSLHVAMVATPPDDPSRIINGSGTKRFLAWAREHFRWVVIDSPPVLPAADVAQLVALADAVLLVVRAQSTPRDLTKRAFEMLGDHLYGVVMNEATIETNHYYRYIADYRQKGTASNRESSHDMLTRKPR